MSYSHIFFILLFVSQLFNLFMHELSVVTSILKTAEEEVKKANGKFVSEIFLEIGKISGIELSSLHFVWPQCVADTVLQNAAITITSPDGKAKCLECDTLFKIEKLFDNCPNCNSPFKEIVSGKEMKIKKLIIN